MRFDSPLDEMLYMKASGKGPVRMVIASTKPFRPGEYLRLGPYRFAVVETLTRAEFDRRRAEMLESPGTPAHYKAQVERGHSDRLEYADEPDPGMQHYYALRRLPDPS